MIPVHLTERNEKYNVTQSFSKLSREWYLGTALYDAIDDGDIRQVTILLVEKHACPNIIIPEYGISPLHLAVGHHCEAFAKEVMRLILRNGGDPNIKADDGITPIHIASAWNRPVIVRLLLSYDADPWQLDDKEKNAFHHAYEQHSWDSMKALDAFRKIENCNSIHKKKSSDFEFSLDKVIVYGKDVQAEYKAMVTSPKIASCSMHSVSTQTEHDTLLLIKRRSKEQSLCTRLSAECDEQLNISGYITDELKVDAEFDLIQTSEADVLTDEVKSKIISHRKGSFYEFWPSIISVKERNSSLNNLHVPTDVVSDDSHRKSVSNANDGKFDDDNDLALLINDNISHIDGDEGRYTTLISEDNLQNICDRYSSLLSEEDEIGKKQLSRVDRSSSAADIAVVNVAECNNVFYSVMADEEQSNEDDKDGREVVKVEDCNVEKVQGQLCRPKTFSDAVVNYSSDLLTEDDECEPMGRRKSTANKFAGLDDKDNLPSPPYFSCLDVECSGGGSRDFRQTKSSSSSSIETDHHDRAELRNDEENREPDEELLLSEQFKYTDDEEGVILIEDRLPRRTTDEDVEDELASVESKIEHVERLKCEKLSGTSNGDDADKKDFLKKVFRRSKGFSSSGRIITNEVKHLYLHKLKRIRKNSPTMNFPLKKSQFGPQLKLLLEQEDDWRKLLSEWSCLESEMIDYFAKHSISDKKWPGGCSSTSFTYLLLDPTVTRNLPVRCDQIGLKKTWHTFLEAIFYVGKGKNQRPYSHLYEAFNAWNRTGFADSMTGFSNMKVKHILEIWELGLGVVCLHVFQNLTSAEALTREAAMIDAVGLPRLKNERSGVYYGNVVNWSRSQKQRLGIYLLYRAMMVLLADGERQLKPNEID